MWIVHLNAPYTKGFDYNNNQIIISTIIGPLGAIYGPLMSVKKLSIKRGK